MKRPKSTILSPERARTLASLLLAALALVVVTCAGAARRADARLGAGPAVAVSTPRARAALPSRASAAQSSGTPPPSVAPDARAGRGTLPGLERFRATLEDLGKKTRKEAVRVLWLGDSHTAADFLPDAVRRPLSAAFGDGGPGFIYVGLGVYRHAGVKVERDGKWRVRPRQPSLWMRQDDGVFGLGGIRVTPEGEASRIVLELAADAVRGEARWELAYRLPTDRARLRVAVDGGQALQVDSTTSGVGSIGHVQWKTPGRARVVIDGAIGDPELFGVVVEAAEPGVVVDTLGINGARVGTPLAWEPGPWIEEAKRRNPSLVVLAYGTNEVGDEVAPWRYGPELEALIARARQAAPGADCLVVGPTDRVGPAWTTLPRVAEIEAVQSGVAARAGCAFWSAWRAMGGEGGLKRWADASPPLASSDRIHLTPRGYGELGSVLAGLILGGAK